MEKQLPAQVYGQRLSYERKLRGWNRDTLAEKLGVYKTYIGRWERGERLPSLLYQQRLGEILGKTAEELGFIQEQVELTDATPLPSHNDRIPNILLIRQRRVRGWTQRDVAEKIGTYPMNISKWERGEANPSQEFQQKLCELFGCSYEDLGLLQSPQAQL